MPAAELEAAKSLPSPGTHLCRGETPTAELEATESLYYAHKKAGTPFVEGKQTPTAELEATKSF